MNTKATNANLDILHFSFFTKLHIKKVFAYLAPDSFYTLLNLSLPKWPKLSPGGCLGNLFGKDQSTDCVQCCFTSQEDRKDSQQETASILDTGCIDLPWHRTSLQECRGSCSWSVNIPVPHHLGKWGRVFSHSLGQASPVLQITGATRVGN